MLSLKNQAKGQSVVKRVTAWYSILITSLLFIIVFAILSVSGYISNISLERDLIEEATEIAHDIDDFEAYDDGIYFVLYDSDGSIVRGQIPKDFDGSLPFGNDELQHMTSQSSRYSYYDTQVRNSQQWIRAITIPSTMSRDMRIFLITLGIGAPVFLIAVISGGYLILKKAFYPIKDMVITSKHITEEKDYSERLTAEVNDIELKELADAFNVMLDSIEDSFEREKQFNHDVSHELRTPLSVILAESDFGQQYINSLDEAKDSYQTINRQAKKMKAMIDQILELSRAENLQTLKTETINLKQLVEEQAKDYQTLAAQKDLELIITSQDNLLINGDHLLLIRLLDNLVSNALKYAKEKVGISLEACEEGVKLIVWDDGIGIAKENHDKVWNRFFQVNTSRQQREDSNSGLGLSLVKRIVDLHGANVKLESELNQGTKFIILFPKL